MAFNRKPDKFSNLIDERVQYPLGESLEWRQTEELEEIITAVPNWILRRGMMLLFTVLVGFFILSSVIQYPDVIKTDLVINSLNSPKTVLARQNGKLARLLVVEGQNVNADQPIAYLESIASPVDVFRLNQILLGFESALENSKADELIIPENLKLGELQSSFQNFYNQYLEYRSTQSDGYYINRLNFLKKELEVVNSQKKQIITEQSIQKKQYLNQKEEYEAYLKLYNNRVISRSEFVQQENKFLASQYPLQQSENSLLNNDGSLTIKRKELLELQRTISENKSKFFQALHQILSDVNLWITSHVLTAPVKGKINFAGIVQENQNVTVGQELFIINPGNTNFFGMIQIPQYSMGKINKGEKTLIKMKSYPYEQYGMIRGHIDYISEVAYKDSVFLAKVYFEEFENKDKSRKIILKNGMHADAEIITDNSSLLRRFYRNLLKVINR
ncbi:HlyD family secretion protein [Pedobacter sp. Leaf194]|uniref:HlyD family secretion protein n=1 Tax=Pedobacter sp. Leaf194 TaxID=1736297 RepID=UPI000702C1C2|nr:HlyD family efflux transporter periplasmic adaptor subunit [Pedobacter sp. Leaf194]KQS36812.1 hypothetical protein ASG14_07180 [Pedobacter sp. Leaf194]